MTKARLDGGATGLVLNLNTITLCLDHHRMAWSQVVQLHRDELHRDFHRDPDLAHLSDLPYWDTARPSPNATAINGRKEPLTMAQRSAPPVQYYISPPDQAIRFRSQPQPQR